MAIRDVGDRPDHGGSGTGPDRRHRVVVVADPFVRLDQLDARRSTEQCDERIGGPEDANRDPVTSRPSGALGKYLETSLDSEAVECDDRSGSGQLLVRGRLGRLRLGRRGGDHLTTGVFAAGRTDTVGQAGRVALGAEVRPGPRGTVGGPTAIAAGTGCPLLRYGHGEAV
jgi:hypothetical protein